MLGSSNRVYKNILLCVANILSVIMTSNKINFVIIKGFFPKNNLLPGQQILGLLRTSGQVYFSRTIKRYSSNIIVYYTIGVDVINFINN